MTLLMVEEVRISHCNVDCYHCMCPLSLDVLAMQRYWFICVVEAYNAAQNYRYIKILFVELN